MFGRTKVKMRNDKLSWKKERQTNRKNEKKMRERESDEYLMKIFGLSLKEKKKIQKVDGKTLNTNKI